MTNSSAQWNAASLQVSLFTIAPTAKSIDIYTALAGTPPDTYEDRTKEAVVRQTGMLGDNLLQVGFNPLRIDIVLSPPPPELLMGSPGVRLSMGAFKDEITSFGSMVQNWLATTEIQASRISLISAAVVETASRKDAYEVLAKYIRSVQVVPEMEELMFRVNWKAKTSLMSEGYFNRITTWSAIKLAVNAGLASGSMTTISEKNYARLDLDINTPHDHTTAIPAGQMAPVFDELVGLAEQTVANGEPR
jgi:hypothetical protein